MIEPGEYDITIQQGATFQLPLHFKDSAGASVNMNGYTVSGTIYDRYGQTLLASFTNTWTVQASGQFTLSIPANTTRTMSGEAQYDVLVTEPNNTKFYLLEGAAFIDTGLTGR